MQSRQDIVTIRKCDYLVLEECGVCSYVPTEVLSFEDIIVERYLETSVADSTNILIDGHIVVIHIVCERAG